MSSLSNSHSRLGLEPFAEYEWPGGDDSGSLPAPPPKVAPPAPPAGPAPSWQPIPGFDNGKDKCVLIEYMLPALEEGDDSSLSTHLYGPMGMVDATYLAQKLPAYMGVSRAQIIQLRALSLVDWPAGLVPNPITHPPQPKLPPALLKRAAVVPGKKKKTTKTKKAKSPPMGQASLQFPSV